MEGPRPRLAHRIIFGTLLAVIIFSIFFRILNYYIELPDIIALSKDIDFKLLILGHEENGLFNFYLPLEDLPSWMPEWPPYYLYFWYFLFSPMGWFTSELLPISLLIWNILSLGLVSFVGIRSYDRFNDYKDFKIFFVFMTLGYLIDCWYGNSNFLILLFLYLSYDYLEKDKKWISGIFFTLGTFKINGFLFLPVILLSKKIKFKDLIYYLIPFTIVCLPYVIFPDFLGQMVYNWAHSDPGIQGLTPIDPIFWKALQPSHLMYISFLYLIYFEHLEEGKRKNRIRTFVITTLTTYYLYTAIVVSVIPAIQLWL